MAAASRVPWLSTDLLFIDSFMVDFIADELPDIEAQMAVPGRATTHAERDHLQFIKNRYLTPSRDNAYIVRVGVISPSPRDRDEQYRYGPLFKAVSDVERINENYQFTPKRFHRSVLGWCRRQEHISYEHHAAAMDTVAHMVNCMMNRVSHDMVHAAVELGPRDSLASSFVRLPFIEDRAAIVATPQSKTTAVFHIMSAMAFWLTECQLAPCLNHADIAWDRPASARPIYARKRETYRTMLAEAYAAHGRMRFRLNQYTVEPKTTEMRQKEGAMMKALRNGFHDLEILSEICSMFIDNTRSDVAQWEKFVQQKLVDSPRGQHLMYRMIRSHGLGEVRIEPNSGERSQQHGMLLHAVRTYAPAMYRYLYTEMGRADVALGDGHAIISSTSPFGASDDPIPDAPKDIQYYFNLLPVSAYKAVPLGPPLEEDEDEWMNHA